MKTLVILLALLVAVPVAAQKKSDTVKISPAPYGNYELGVSFGGGREGFMFDFYGRIYFVGIAAHFTGFGNIEAKPSQLDYAPPHYDYELVPFKSGIYGITIGPHIRFTDDFGAFVSLGVSATNTAYVPRSNATGWYYKTERIDETTWFEGGGGIMIYPSGKLCIGAGYITRFGAFVRIGALM